MARTFLDLCGDPEPGVTLRQPYHRRAMERVYNDALGRRGMTFTQEAAVFAIMARRGRWGTSLAREILKRFGPRHEPTRSDAESLFLELLDAHDLPMPEREVPIAGPDGWIGTVDNLWRKARHIVEVDSRWHDGPLDQAADAERDGRFVAAGYSVARYRYGRMVAEPQRIAAELGAAVCVISGSPPPEQ